MALKSSRNSSIINHNYWNNKYETQGFLDYGDNVIFNELFSEYVPYGGECFEIGCYPGTFLAHLARKFDYTISGIDLCPKIIDEMEPRLRKEGFSIGDLKIGDFLEFDSNKQYDLVCSFGFIEHFENLEDIFNRHIKLVKPGGLLIVSCPNFRCIQYLLHKSMDGENLKKHNLKAMDLERWRCILKWHDMEPIYHGYYRTMGFWSENRNIVIQGFAFAIRKASIVIEKLVNKPNRFLSPHMISISKKIE
jgi:2-polyprenyl-3-methyl-5-hydroxy-6-metoxy-1,4-benzoquinol methylase